MFIKAPKHSILSNVHSNRRINHWTAAQETWSINQLGQTLRFVIMDDTVSFLNEKLLTYHQKIFTQSE